MTILFPFPGNEDIAHGMKGYPIGDVTIRHFPDGESYVKLNTDVWGQDIAIICSLDQPDQKAMALMFFTHLARELGAKRIGLIAPYLGYMRQDKRFHEGEAITSVTFASFLSAQVDWLVTIDPHLHRHKSLDEIYSIPCQTLYANDLIGQWVRENVDKPLLVGPDEESGPLIATIAGQVGAPFIVMKKIRHGDTDVEVALPDVESYKDRTPLLIDDVISTGHTLIEATAKLRQAGLEAPICVGVHAIFAGDAYEALQNAGVSQIVTCNTIKHVTNEIDVSGLLEGVMRERGKDDRRCRHPGI